MNRYWAGPAVAVDWGENQPELAPADRRRMMARMPAGWKRHPLRTLA